MGYRDYSTSKAHIVDAAGHGDFTTISSAITAAASGDTIFIVRGTYVEDLTITKSLKLYGNGFQANFSVNNPIISGLITVSGNSIVVGINGLSLASSGVAGFLSLTGNSSIVTLQNCQLAY